MDDFAFSIVWDICTTVSDDLLTAGEFTSEPVNTGRSTHWRWLFKACSDPWWTKTQTRRRSRASETVSTLSISLLIVSLFGIFVLYAKINLLYLERVTQYVTSHAVNLRGPSLGA